LREYASESEYKSSLSATKKRITQYPAVQIQKIADIMEAKELPDIVGPEAPKAKAKRDRKAGPKADTIETPPADGAGINNEDGTDENGANE